MTIVEPPITNESDPWVQAANHADHRAPIEQAKGMLMFVYGITADDAFSILRFHSQEHNIKLRLIAEQIVRDMTALSVSKGPARVVRIDGLMLKAHSRIAAVAERHNNNRGHQEPSG